MLAGQIFISVTVALFSLLIAAAAGHPAIIMGLCYCLAGVSSLLALALIRLQQD